MLVAITVNVLLILLMVVLWLWIRVMGKYGKLKSEYEKVRHNKRVIARGKKQARLAARQAEEILDEARGKAKEIVGELQAMTEREQQAIVGEVKETTQEQLTKLGEDLRQKLTVEVEKEVKAYKDQRIAAVDQEIYKAVEQASEAVIGKRLSLADHEELVTKAIEESL